MANTALAMILLVSAANLSDPWLTLKMTPGHPKETVVIEVGTVLRTNAEIAANPNEEFGYWAKMTVRLSDLNGVYWTDSHRCPQVKDVLRNASQLKIPRAALPGLEPEFSIDTDAALYELALPSTYDGRLGGQTTIQAKGDTPLATLFEDSYRALHRCWSRELPHRANVRFGSKAAIRKRA